MDRHVDSKPGQVRETESREVRPPDRRQVLPWKISVKGGACAIATGDAPLGAPLTVIFARRENARRGEGGPVRSCRRGHPVARWSGYRLPAGAGAADRRQRRARLAPARRARQAAAPE